MKNTASPIANQAHTEINERASLERSNRDTARECTARGVASFTEEDGVRSTA